MNKFEVVEATVAELRLASSALSKARDVLGKNAVFGLSDFKNAGEVYDKLPELKRDILGLVKLLRDLSPDKNGPVTFSD